MKSREEQLTWAKQRALICVGVGRFADAVAGLRADLGKGVIQRASLTRIKSGERCGARPGFASADRVDRGPQVPCRLSASFTASQDRLGIASCNCRSLAMCRTPSSFSTT